MIYFIGAGPGAADLITVRGAEVLKNSGIIIYAGSLVNYELIKIYASENCEVYDSSKMTLEEIIEKIIDGHKRNLIVSRLHSGDPALYGAIREQMRILREKNIDFEIIPGVSSLFAASAALKVEFMIPEICQTLKISRIEGRTPAGEKNNESLAFFLSAGLIDELCEELIYSKKYNKNTPAAIIYKASWPEEKIITGNLGNLAELAKESGIYKSAIIFVGEFLSDNYLTQSKLYDKNFSHEFREKN